MKKTKKQKNKNNPTKPENLQKKEYLESFEKLKRSIIRKQEKSEIYIDNRKHNKFLKERDEEYNKVHEEYIKKKGGEVNE